MKIGGFLIAFLVISLSAIPCCTFVECGDEVVAEAEDQHKEEAPGECEDSCSPFLNCGSCAGFTIQNSPEEDTFTFNLPVDQTADYIGHGITGVIINNIWQPPRLG